MPTSSTRLISCTKVFGMDDECQALVKGESKGVESKIWVSILYKKMVKDPQHYHS